LPSHQAATPGRASLGLPHLHRDRAAHGGTSVDRREDAAHVTIAGSATVLATPTVGTLDHLVLVPGSATIAIGGSQLFRAQGFDAANNSLGDVTSATTFTVDGTLGCPEATCTLASAGDHTVTGTYGTATGTTTLTVVAAPR